MDIGGRINFHFVMDGVREDLEPIASLGFGYGYIEGGANEFVMPIDFGIYWYPNAIFNGHLGLGTRMGFNILIGDADQFIYNWQLASVKYYF